MNTIGALRVHWHASATAESIFNLIFEIYAVFTCYLTYYKPNAKKVNLARRVCAGTPARPQDNFFGHDGKLI